MLCQFGDKLLNPLHAQLAFSQIAREAQPRRAIQLPLCRIFLQQANQPAGIDLVLRGAKSVWRMTLAPASRLIATVSSS
ncbi:hypothetical protein CRX72_15030 [Pantoea sp. BRM17]|nr:hypothetical protein CRX72_15030 [Pantoea sp. BRM17]